MDKILVAEDDERLLYIISKSLESAGYTTLTAADGKIAIEILNTNLDINLVIVDLIMPNVNGLDLCKYIRENRNLSNIPILIITGQVDMYHKLKGFEAGADDYITKPIEFVEFMLRVKALLRRGNIINSNSVEVVISKNETEVENKNFHLKLVFITERGDLIKIDYLTSMLYAYGKKEYLTSTELDILDYLIKKKGVPTDYKEILSNVLGYTEGKGNPVAVRTHISNLRAKIEKNVGKSEILISIPKRGYVLKVQATDKNKVKLTSD